MTLSFRTLSFKNATTGRGHDGADSARRIFCGSGASSRPLDVGAEQVGSADRGLVAER
jgi:hypothetical protein